MSGGKTKSKSYSGSGQLWAQPFAQAGASSVQNVFNQNQPGLQNLTGIAQNTLVPALTGKFQSGLGGANAASGYRQSVVNGDFMNGNPYINDILTRMRGDIGNDVNGTFARSGRYGSDAHSAGLTRELANAENNLLYNNYTTEMGRRDQAAQGLTDANTQDAAQTLAALGVGAELPYTGSNSLANALGALFAGGTEKSKSKQGVLGSIMQGLGAAAGAYASSSRDLKDDIKVLGPWDDRGDGLEKVSFRYKWEPKGTERIGVIAEQVKELRPWAYIDNFFGKPGVNYAALAA